MLAELNLRIPVFVAPMFLISGPELVIEAAKAGVIGAFPAPNARTIEDLRDWMNEIDETLKAENLSGNWAVNMIVHPTYDRFEEELALIQKFKPKIVISALGSPKRILHEVHSYEGKVFSDVISVSQARKAIAAGADGLVAVCAGAGGHTGSLSPFALVQEVRKFWQGPLIAGGAVSSAEGVGAMRLLGADLAYMGTHFISAKESLVSDEYRAMLVGAEAEDIVTTAAVSGVPGNWLRPSLEQNGISDTALKSDTKVDFSNIHGDSKAWKNVWGAGQGVGGTLGVYTTRELVDQLARDWEALDLNFNR